MYDKIIKISILDHDGSSHDVENIFFIRRGFSHNTLTPSRHWPLLSLFNHQPYHGIYYVFMHYYYIYYNNFKHHIVILFYVLPSYCYYFHYLFSNVPIIIKLTLFQVEMLLYSLQCNN